MAFYYANLYGILINMDEKRKIIGERIKKARRVAGLTQSELSEKLDLGLRHIQKIEKGETALTIERLEVVSNILNVPLAYFLNEDGEDGIVFGVATNEIAENRPDKDRSSKDDIICEYTRNTVGESLKLTFPYYISTEDLKEKVDVLVNRILGARNIERTVN
jgi:transcriptional regulator with XRE-family HTH domain